MRRLTAMHPPSTRRRRAVVAGLVCAAVGVAPALASPQTDERTIYVSVIGQDGAPIGGLGAADFLVREDNLIREVTGVGAATEPVSYVVLIDTTPAAAPIVRDLRVALTRFVGDVLTASPASEIAFEEFGGAAVMTRDLTSDRAALEAVIPKIFPRQDGSSVLSEGLVDAARRLARTTGPRRVIVTINMEPATEASQMQPREVAEAVRRSGASVWAVSVQTGTGRNPNRDQLLTGLANNSGGARSVILTSAALESLLASVAANTVRQYAVSFRRPAGAEAAKLTTVGVNREGARALTLMWSSR